MAAYQDERSWPGLPAPIVARITISLLENPATVTAMTETVHLLHLLNYRTVEETDDRWSWRWTIAPTW